MAMRRSRFVRRAGRSVRRFRVRSRPFRRTTLRRSNGGPGSKRSRDRFQATSDINRGGFNYKRKRFNPRVLRNRLWRASESAQKYRSNNSFVFTYVSNISATLMSVNIVAKLPDVPGSRFWEPTGGLVTNNDTPATTSFGGGDLFVRGGLTRLTILNPAVSNSPVKIITWHVRTTINGTIPSAPFPASGSWDPSLPDSALLATDPNRDVFKLYKFWGHEETMLKPGEACERISPVRAEKIDQDQWTGLRNRDFWFIAVQKMTSIGVAVSVDATLSWNVAFTGDRVI